MPALDEHGLAFPLWNTPEAIRETYAEWQHPETLVSEVPKPRRREGTISNLLRKNVGNLPIRVPAVDWSKVIVGEKRMFRTYSERGGNRETAVVPADTECPRPVLLYAVRHNGPGRSRRWEAKTGILMSHRQEPLGSITPGDLALEGFEYLNAFRWTWKQRYKKTGWRPTDMVSVLQVRPVWPEDHDWIRDWAYDELYGEWL